MPSLSAFAVYTFANLGPLTTPFTAAPACATSAPSNHVVGQLPSGAAAEVQCPPASGVLPWYADGCWPSAARAASLAEALAARTSTTVIDSLPTQSAEYSYVPQLVEYFSPGVHCPAGWTTAGTLARDAVATPTPPPAGTGGTTATAPWPTPTYTGTGGTTSTATAAASLDQPDYPVPGVGVFTTALSYPERPEWSWPFLFRKAEALARALEPDETLAYCCPSDYEGYDLGLCVSTMGPATDAGFTEVCYPTFGTSGLTMAPLATSASEGPFVGATGILTAYTITPAVPLVYRASDLPAATGTGTGTGTTGGPAPTGTDAGGEGADETPVPANAGPRNVPGEGLVSWGWAAMTIFSLLSGAGAFLL